MSAPEGGAVEFDELCLRQPPPLWPWVGVSRLTHRVLGWALGDRSDGTLARAQVPGGYRGGLSTPTAGVPTRACCPRPSTARATRAAG